LLDITATIEGRATMLDVVRKVADAATVPLPVGGGISDLASAALVLLVSGINTPLLQPNQGN